MTQLIKRTGSVINGTRTQVLVAPAAKQLIIFSLIITNVDPDSPQAVTVEVKTGPTTYRKIVANDSIPVGKLMKVPRIVLEATDELLISSTESGTVEVYVSYLEQG